MQFRKFRIFDFFYRGYHAFPSVYNGISQLFSFGQWEKWQDRVFEDLVGKKILEIGVGPGNLLLRMAKKGFIVTGIELRKGMAYEARKKVKVAGYEIDILEQSVYHMPFKESSFDCIVMTFVLAEILQLEKALFEMKRVLKKEGRIIVIAGGMPQDRNMMAQFLFSLVRPVTTLKLERDNKRMFEEVGFFVTRTDFGPFNIVHKIIAVKQ
jgi:ubiquinone/menaquinone biosynthesis C-methylase UbiE